MSIGHSPTVSQYTPDIRKPGKYATAEEIEEANRRIGGPDPSLIPESASDLRLDEIK